MLARQHTRATATPDTAEVRTLHEDDLDGVSGGKKGRGGDVAMETIELAVEGLRLREDELKLVSGGIDSKFDELESSVDGKQARLVQRLEPSR